MSKVQLSDLISSLKNHFIVKQYWARQDLNPGGVDYGCSICNAHGWETDEEKTYKLASEIHDAGCFVRLAELWLDQNEGENSYEKLDL